MLKTVLLTGGNQGIGFYTTKDLVLSGKVGKVIFTYRREEAGKQAMKDLIEKHNVPEEKLDMHYLDVTKPESMKELREYIIKEYGTISCLVNNAGILFIGDKVFEEQLDDSKAKLTFDVNFEGPVLMTEILGDLVEEGGKIIHVASGLANLGFTNEELRDKYWKAKTIEELRNLYPEYLQARKDGTLEKLGYDVKSKFHCYGLSKLCVVIATRIQAENDKKGRIICCLCPGFVKTHLNDNFEQCSEYGAKNASDHASDTPLHVILNSTKDWHGGFFNNKDNRVKLYE